MAKDSKVSDRQYFNIYFNAGDQKKFYKREKYDILSYLGDLGGIFDILFILGSGATTFFSSRLFLASLISKAYKV